MSKKVGIIDYGAGNLFSVDNAIKGLVHDRFVSSDPEELMNADYIIFPGVGSFSDGMKGMKKYGYGRATDQLNIEIRHNRISRDKAIEIAQEIDGQYSKTNMKEFCKYIDITEDEFHEKIDSFVNHDIFEKVNGMWKMKYERI